jgi:Holliday junction resolvasome RuvABC endonuclease subunit
MGVDLGVHKLALVCITDGQHAAQAYDVGPGPRDIQLLELGAFAHDFALLHGADSVWIEDTIIGNNRKYSIGLAQTMGAVLSDLGQVRLHNGCDTRTVDNKTWKKELVGNGNASKEQVQNYIREVHPVYAPLCGDDQDLYDACCIALYGLRILDRAAHIQLQPGPVVDQDEPDPTRG